MDAARAFEVALDHYNKGENLLNFPEAVLGEEQALHFQRAAAHFAAGNLVLSLSQLEKELEGQPGQAQGQAADPGALRPQ